MTRRIRRKSIVWASLGAVTLGLAGIATGCTRTSNGTMWVREAPLAEGWPDLTPIGVVEVKDYPVTRAAIVREVAPEPTGADDAGEIASTDTHDQSTPQESTEQVNSAFMTLFNHIKSNDIAMTSPVDMGYQEPDPDAADTSLQQTSMAFLYRHTDQGQTGTDGAVTVEDLPARTYVSIGVRGDYTDKHFMKNLAIIDAWLEENADEWQPDGPPRYLGYNSPFIPSFLKYGEVQRPIRHTNE